MPGYQYRMRHKVVASLNGQNIGTEVWCIVCAKHPDAEVLEGICTECWREGSRNVYLDDGKTLEEARQVMAMRSGR